MIQRILAYHSIDPSIYPIQLPVLHLIVAALSLFSDVNSLDLLKYIIPLLSVIGLYAVYRFTKEISSSTKTAFFAGILLLCGTPYLHWIAQGVRETLGIALFALAFYISFTAIQSYKKQYLLLSLLLVGGLVLTHNLSSMIFFISWIAVSLVYLYLICDMKRIRTISLFSLLIALFTVIFIVVWGMVRSGYEYAEFNNLMNTIYHSDFGIILFILSLIILYLIPLIIPDKITELRSLGTRIFFWKKTIYTFFIIGTLMGSGVVLLFVLGKSGFILSYPLPMFFNGLCMVFLALIGLYYFLEIDRLHVLAWIAALALFLVLTMSAIIPFVDPLRIMEFLYIPLAIIAAFGMTRIAESIGSRWIFSIILASLVVISIITSFPSVVFWGQPFEQGHPLYDNRNWVIQHPASEILAISWLDSSRARGIIDTDAYTGYAARGIILTDSLTIQTAYPFIRENGYPHSTETDAQEHYLIILSRMTEYLEFSTQWMQEKNPLSDTDLKKINNECDLLYNNGKAKVYSFSVP